MKNKGFLTLFLILGISGGISYYARFIVNPKAEAKEEKISKLIIEKKEKEEKLEKLESRFEIVENENKDLKAMKEGKK